MKYTKEFSEGQQLDMFSLPAPFQNHSETSKAAAAAIEPIAGTLRAQMLEFIRSAPATGYTDEEMQNLMAMHSNTQRPRRVDLVRSGLVIDSGITRLTTSGRDAVVWKAVATKELT